MHTLRFQATKTTDIFRILGKRKRIARFNCFVLCTNRKIKLSWPRYYIHKITITFSEHDFKYQYKNTGSWQEKQTDSTYTSRKEKGKLVLLILILIWSRQEPLIWVVSVWMNFRKAKILKRYFYWPINEGILIKIS